MAETQGQRRSQAAPSEPKKITEVESATDTEATRAYNEAHIKPGPSQTEQGEVRFVSGPAPDADEVDLGSLGESGGSTVVTIPQHVYEEFPAPGAPDRTIRRLLYRRGQTVPRAALQAHAERAKGSKGGKSYNPVTETK